MSKNRRSGGRGEFSIPSEVTDFVEITMKKYKKTYADPYADKKSIKKGYLRYMLDLFPEVIALLVKYPNVPAVKDLIPAIYEKVTDENFIKLLTKEIEENGADAFDNAIYLPVVVHGFLKTAAEWQKKLQAEATEGATVTIDTSDLVDLSTMILKKKIKKLKKLGVDESLAFDVLSIIPDSDILKRSAAFRLRQLMYVLYEHAKSKEIDFGVIARKVVGEEYYPTLIVTLLLEKKEAYVQFTEEQKKFFNKVTDWVFNTMEGSDDDGMDKKDIAEILKSYAGTRRRDKEQGKDSNRRFFIGSLPESDFPKVTKVVKRLIADDGDIEEFLK